MNEAPKPRNIYSPRIAVISPAGHTPAQQQFKDDCDINKIMRRFAKNDLVDHVAKHQPEYGFASPTDYHQAMNIIAMADTMFNELPSGIRNEFSNNPQAFLEFVQNPANAARAQELGIALSPEAALAASELQDVANPDEVAPSPEQDVPGAAPAA